MLLEKKTAIIYGAGGAIGSAVAAAFAREGAILYLTGRNLGPVEAAADRVRAAGHGPEVHVARVDAMVEDEIEAHADSVDPGIDISFNAVGLDHFQGIPFVDLDRDRFAEPLTARLVTHFLTARAAARRMATRGGGVILMLTATPAKMALPYSASFGVACAAVEALARSLAAEVGPHGVRVVCLRSAGSPDSPGVGLAFEARARALGITAEEVRQSIEDEIPLRRMPRLADVADAAVIMAADHSRALTATVLNVTGGATPD
jgi:NAD(P)-dependent dehydrogenase (short-subunit alcohol dehydrogenase family)